MVPRGLFRDSANARSSPFPSPVRAVCVLLLAGILVLGVRRSLSSDTISSSYAAMNCPVAAVTASTALQLLTHSSHG